LCLNAAFRIFQLYHGNQF